MRGGVVFAYLYICKVRVCVGLESRYACHPNLGASSPQDCRCHGDNLDQVQDRVNNQQVSVGSGGRNARASHCSALELFYFH